MAHHFSHNAPHRPYIHCVDQGERKEKEREEAEISVRHRKPSGREQSSDKKLAGQRRIINQRERVTQRNINQDGGKKRERSDRGRADIRRESADWGRGSELKTSEPADSGRKAALLSFWSVT